MKKEFKSIVNGVIYEVENDYAIVTGTEDWDKEENTNYEIQGSLEIEERVNIGGKVYTVKKIEMMALAGLRSITELILPDSIEEIGEEAIECAEKLTKLVLSKNLRKIEDVAFQGMRSLEELNIPISVEEIWGDAFADMDNLKRLTIPKKFKDEIDDIFTENCKPKDMSKVKITYI